MPGTVSQKIYKTFYLLVDSLYVVIFEVQLLFKGYFDFVQSCFTVCFSVSTHNFVNSVV